MHLSRLNRTLFGFVLIGGLLGAGIALEAWQDPSSETVAKPKKKPSSTDDPNIPQPDADKIPSKLNKKRNDIPEGLPTFRSDVNSVTVDIAVMDNKGNFIPKIPGGNFRVFEDEVPQKTTGFSVGESGMTVCLVVEFSARFQGTYTRTWFETLQAAYSFLGALRKDDYIAVVAYDMRTEILSDFTTDQSKWQEALARLRIPGFREMNMYDALVETADRMSGIEGRKAIVLLTSGLDTFSKLTFDKTRKALQIAGVPVYAISLFQADRIMADNRMGAVQRLDFLQADSTLKTFAKETGGQAFFPRFSAEYPQIFGQVNQGLRNQYAVTYTPSNQVRDGKYRKIRVELVNPSTNEPLRVVDEKGKPIKYQIVAKAGYTAPREIE
jgi:Ca-activated chloride channel family protein